MDPLYRFPSVRRIVLNRELNRLIERLNESQPSKVLDVGAKDAPYAENIHCDQYLTLDLDPAHDPDLCCDVHDIDSHDNAFDAIIATEVLEHTHSPRRVVSEIHRVLKPEGICLLSVPFIYQYHPDPKDYFRYTRDSLRTFFQDYDRCEVHPHGNRLQAIWLLLTTSKKSLGLLSWLNPLIAKVRQEQTSCPLGYIVWAEK